MMIKMWTRNTLEFVNSVHFNIRLTNIYYIFFLLCLMIYEVILFIVCCLASNEFLGVLFDLASPI